MSKLLTYYEYVNNAQDEEEIDDCYNLSISLGSEIKNNNLRITLKNNPINTFSDGTIQHRWVEKDTREIKFKAVKATQGVRIDEELIYVYAHYTDTDPTITVESNDYLLFPGVIEEGTIKFSDSENSIELKCVDRSSAILNKIAIPQKYSVATYTSPLIIQNLLRNIDGTPSNVLGFTAAGVEGLGKTYLIDARTFTDGLKMTSTTTSAATRKLIDAAGDFVNNAIAKGDWIRNTTDETYAYVISVDSATQLTISKDIMASGEGYKISDGFIQDVRSDGSAFPKMAFSSLLKPINEYLEQLSQVEALNSAAELISTLIVKRGAKYFLDSKNRFHWYIPSDTPEHIMVVGQTAAVSPDTNNHIIQNVKLTNKVDGTVNFIIFDAGLDMDDKQIRSYHRARFSGFPIVKDSKRSYLSISRKMKQEDGLTLLSGESYDYPGSYPVTPKWDRQARSVANDTEYNDNFKEEAILRGKELASAEMQKRANPRWKGSITVRGEPIIVGDLIQFTSTKHGINNILMRVTGVSHNISAQAGWITDLDVEEDEREYQNVV